MMLILLKQSNRRIEMEQSNLLINKSNEIFKQKEKETLRESPGFAGDL